MKQSGFLIVLVLIVGSCAQKVDLANIEANAARQQAASPSPEKFDVLTSAAVIDAFKAAGFPIKEVEIYDESTDPNNLLGRPGQYVGKINFSDSRIARFGRDNTIEVFLTPEDLERRKTYTESISKTGGMFLQYIYAHKNALIRLNHKLLPKDAAAYEAVLKSL